MLCFSLLFFDDEYIQLRMYLVVVTTSKFLPRFLLPFHQTRMSSASLRFFFCSLCSFIIYIYIFFYVFKSNILIGFFQWFVIYQVHSISLLNSFSFSVCLLLFNQSCPKRCLQQSGIVFSGSSHLSSASVIPPSPLLSPTLLSLILIFFFPPIAGFCFRQSS